MSTLCDSPDAPRSQSWQHPILFLVVLSLVLLADLASKYWVFRSADTSQDLWLLQLQQYFWRDTTWLVPQINPGAAWSMGSDYPGLILLLTAFLIPLLCAYYWFAVRFSSLRADHLGFAAIIGGALGNGWDRLLATLPNGGYGGVRDFIHCDLNIIGIPYVWPTFNIADSGITLGLAVVVWASLFHARNCKGSCSESV